MERRDAVSVHVKEDSTSKLLLFLNTLAMVFSVSMEGMSWLKGGRERAFEGTTCSYRSPETRRCIEAPLVPEYLAGGVFKAAGRHVLGAG